MEKTFDRKRLFIIGGEHPEEVSAKVLAKRTVSRLNERGYSAFFKPVPFCETVMASYVGKATPLKQREIKEWSSHHDLEDKDEAPCSVFDRQIDELKTGLVFNFHNYHNADATEMIKGSTWCLLTEKPPIFYNYTTQLLSSVPLEGLARKYYEAYFSHPPPALEMQIFFEIPAIFKENKNANYAEYRKHYPTNRENPKVVDALATRKAGFLGAAVVEALVEGIERLSEIFFRELIKYPAMSEVTKKDKVS